MASAAALFSRRTRQPRKQELEVLMMRSTKHMRRFEITATDSPIGSVEDFYFDDERWAMRYLVVDTGKWLPGRRVLISPLSIARAEWAETRAKV